MFNLYHAFTLYTSTGRYTIKTPSILIFTFEKIIPLIDYISILAVSIVTREWSKNAHTPFWFLERKDIFFFQKALNVSVSKINQSDFKNPKWGFGNFNVVFNLFSRKKYQTLINKERFVLSREILLESLD